MRILYLVNDVNFFLSHRLPIALAAVEQGFEVHVATPNPQASRHALPAGLTFHTISLHRSGRSPWQELRSLLSIARLYRKVKPDLVHTVTIKPVIYGGLLARLLRLPALVSAVPGLGYLYIQSGRLAGLRRWLINRLYRMALGHANSRVIFQNDDDRDYFLHNGIVEQAQVRMIRGSGVDLAQFRPVPEPEGTPIVLLASRMLWDKGVGEFVAAASELRHKGIACRCVLAGGTDEYNPAAVEAPVLDDWVAAGTVEWWGQRDDMAQVLSQAAIVVLPSYREGLPKVLVEAAAAGRPVITTNVPGCRDVVRAGETGLIVPARDSHALAGAIGALLADKPARARMGQAGRKMAEADFSLDDVIQRTLSIYCELVAVS